MHSTETSILEPVTGNISAAAACAAIMRALASSGLGAIRSSSSAKLSPLATVATQTDPWSDDCRLSMFGDDYDDVIERNVSEHVYQLYDRHPTAQDVPLYDYILQGGSETDDDGYDVIDEIYSGDDGVDVDDNVSKKELQSIINDNVAQSTIVQQMFSPVLPTSQIPFPVKSCRSLTSSFAGQQLSCNQSTIRLGVESRRPTFFSDDVMGNNHSSFSSPLADSDAPSRRTCGGRLVPTMGTRLRSVRQRSASDAGSGCSPVDALEHLTTSPPLPPTTEWWTQDAIVMSTSSNSEGEQSTVGVSRPADVSSASSLQSGSWSSDDSTAAAAGLTRRVRFRADPGTISDSTEPHDAVTKLTVPVPEASVADTTPTLAEEVPDRCPRISANVCDEKECNISSPVRVTKSQKKRCSTASTTERKPVGVMVAAESKSEGTRRRFIYENYADVMYTNEANLAHTIMVQQRLFQQLIADNSVRSRDDDADHRNNNDVDEQPPPLPARRGVESDSDGVQSRRRGRSKPSVIDNPPPRNQFADDDDSNKWVVRRRKDGTRYVTRSRHDDAENANKVETKLRHSRNSDEPKGQPFQVSKHRRVSTTSGHLSSGVVTVTTRHDNNQRISGAATAEMLSKTATKSSQHHPILAVVTI